MKKALSLVLALLVALSMFSIASFAAEEGDTVEVKFVYQTPGVGEGNSNPETVDPIEFNTVIIENGGALPTGVVPDVPDQFEGMIDGKTYRFTFKGWRCDANDKLYYDGTINFAEIDADKVTFTAEYSTEDISSRQSFWNLIESIFERINKIFEYFAVVFNW